MDRSSKSRLLKHYSELFNNCEAIFLMQNSGLSVPDSRSVRTQLKKIGSKFMVIKNNLAKIALDDSKFSQIKSLLFGPIVVACCTEPVSTSKLLVKICKDKGKLDIIGAAIAETPLNKQEVMALSKMLTQDEIRAKITILINAAACKIARAICEPRVKLIRIFQSYAKNNKHFIGG